MHVSMPKVVETLVASSYSEVDPIMKLKGQLCISKHVFLSCFRFVILFYDPIS